MALSRYLLDTHALIWAVLFPHLLSSKAKSLIETDENELFASAATAFEIATKVRLGKLPEGQFLEQNYSAALAASDIRSLAISAAIGLRAGRLPWPHRDPFDRIIAATALEHDVFLLSKDDALDSFGVRRIW